MWFERHAATLLRDLGPHSSPLLPCAYRSLSSHPRMDAGVEDKGVNASVPCYVHKADEPPVFIGPYVREAAR